MTEIETELVVLAVFDRLRAAVTTLAEADALSTVEQRHLANVINQAIDLSFTEEQP